MLQRISSKICEFPVTYFKNIYDAIVPNKLKSTYRIKSVTRLLLIYINVLKKTSLFTLFRESQILTHSQIVVQWKHLRSRHKINQMSTWVQFTHQVILIYLQDQVSMPVCNKKCRAVHRHTASVCTTAEPGTSQFQPAAASTEIQSDLTELGLRTSTHWCTSSAATLHQR